MHSTRLQVKNLFPPSAAQEIWQLLQPPLGQPLTVDCCQALVLLLSFFPHRCIGYGFEDAAGESNHKAATAAGDVSQRVDYSVEHTSLDAAVAAVCDAPDELCAIETPSNAAELRRQEEADAATAAQLPWQQWAAQAVAWWGQMQQQRTWDSLWFTFFSRLAKHDSFVRLPNLCSCFVWPHGRPHHA